MLAKKSRLNKNKDFDLVFREGASVYGKFLGVKAKKNEKNLNRFGILIGTKISKLAVVRNLYKRRIKSVIRQEEKSLKTGYDSVIIVFKDIKDKGFQEVQDEIKKIFTKLKFYK